MPLLRLLAALLLLSSPAWAEDPPLLTFELNKLEPLSAAAGNPAGCLAYFMLSDAAPKIDALRVDLVFFGTDGAVARRLALDLAPIAPGRTQIRAFELRDLPCDGIGQVLVNDVISCTVGGAEQTGCIDRLKTASRLPVKLIK